jgi:hypothetical protein
LTVSSTRGSLDPRHIVPTSNMTDTASNIHDTSGSARALNPPGTLLTLIIALLTPMFLGVSSGDLGLARMAAIETVDAYRARHNADLIAVAQIIGFGLAALGSLSLSMAEDISISMASPARKCQRLQPLG